MKIKEGFTLRDLGPDHIVVAESMKLVNFNKMIVLNDTAAYLWKAVGNEEFDAQKLCDLLLAKFNVDPERAMADAQAVVDKWIEVEVVE